ncbi:MAG: aminoglycoside phosphotransferase family protein [Porphyromonas sp.]|nr:aminoglycoside phosphotransferase family protein [Porphyromonas sp.]
MDITRLQDILTHFPIPEPIINIKPIGNGHINDTYGVVVDTAEGEKTKYVLQRINDDVFTDVDTLQHNIFAVTSHIRQKLEAMGTTDIDRQVLTFLKTREGEKYIRIDGQVWRLSLYIEGSVSYDNVTPELAYEAGKAFGDFHTMLADIPEGLLGETIPDFHNMTFRLQQLREAVAEDKAGRYDEVKDLVQELEQRAEEMTIQDRLFAEGKLKKRTNHCDTKVNNILFDKATGEVLCVIDLDTVMPGFVLSDIGDFIRTAVNTGEEDDENLERIQVNTDIFKSYTRGYMEKAQTFLSPLEIKLLPYGGRLLTYMQTVRFLTDYLNGDTYYKTHKPKHNLIRSIAQFEFLRRLEEQREEMDHFMDQWL